MNDEVAMGMETDDLNRLIYLMFPQPVDSVALDLDLARAIRRELSRRIDQLEAAEALERAQEAEEETTECLGRRSGS